MSETHDWIVKITTIHRVTAPDNIAAFIVAQEQYRVGQAVGQDITVRQITADTQVHVDDYEPDDPQTFTAQPVWESDRP